MGLPGCGGKSPAEGQSPQPQRRTGLVLVTGHGGLHHQESPMSKPVTTATATKQRGPGVQTIRQTGQPAQAQKSTGKALRKTAGIAAVATLPQTPASRAPSKKAMIEGLVRRPEGAALTDLMNATGWQQHSVRAALTGLRKAGHRLLREGQEAGGSRYRIAKAPGSGKA